MSALFVDGSGAGGCVKVGSPAPDFVLRTDGDRDWHLSDHFGGVTVLLFYPQNETMVCTKQLCSVRDNWADYLATRATIVGVSPATPGEHQAFGQRRQLPIPLLADPNRDVTRKYGQHWLFPIKLTRAVVVIDAKGIVRNIDIMLRAFRPSDAQLITDIYAARGDEFNEKYEQLKRKVASANQS